jgi:hypothetical protein
MDDPSRPQAGTQARVRPSFCEYADCGKPLRPTIGGRPRRFCCEQHRRMAAHYRAKSAPKSAGEVNLPVIGGKPLEPFENIEKNRANFRTDLSVVRDWPINILGGVRSRLGELDRSTLASIVRLEIFR